MDISVTEHLLQGWGYDKNLLVMVCDPWVQDLAAVTADMLALFDQFHGFATHRRSSAGQSGNLAGLFPMEFAGGHHLCCRPASFLTDLCRILHPTIMTDRSPGCAERKTAKKQVQFWAKSCEKLPSGYYRRLA